MKHFGPTAHPMEKCTPKHFLHFSAGMIAGSGLTDGFQDLTTHAVDTVTHFYSDSKDFIVGPMVAVHVPLGFSVEFDALYRPLHLANSTLVAPSTNLSSSATVGTWEFPLLLQYRFIPTPIIKPLVEVGPSFRAGSGQDASPSHHGLTLGAGLEAKILKLRITPQLRFTRWGGDSPSMIFAAPRTSLNQVEFLVGFSL
jgi:hypothetical protein